jgi:hypothetical protein
MLAAVRGFDLLAPSSTHSTTISSGTMNDEAPTPTRKPSMIASVSGRRMRIVVP